MKVEQYLSAFINNNDGVTTAVTTYLSSQVENFYTDGLVIE